MPRWINMDGILHVAGDTTYCSCERDHVRHRNSFSTCRRCGSIQHWQPVYGGIMEACPVCDKDWNEGPMPQADGAGVFG